MLAAIGKAFFKNRLHQFLGNSTAGIADAKFRHIADVLSHIKPNRSSRCMPVGIGRQIEQHLQQHVMTCKHAQALFTGEFQSVMIFQKHRATQRTDVQHQGLDRDRDH